MFARVVRVLIYPKKNKIRELYMIVVLLLVILVSRVCVFPL